jgi:hypothetical protein
VILSHRPVCSALPSPLGTSVSSTFRPASLPDCNHICPPSPLAATLLDLPASVANKRLTIFLTPLDATLTKNEGGPELPICLQPPRIPAFKPATFQPPSSFLSSRRSDGATLTLLSLFAPRAFHISFAISRFHTLSQKYRVDGGYHKKTPEGLIELHRRRSAAATLIALVSSNSVDYRQESLRV